MFSTFWPIFGFCVVWPYCLFSCKIRVNSKRFWKTSCEVFVAKQFFLLLICRNHFWKVLDVFEGFQFLWGLAVLVHFGQILGDLKGFRTFLEKKLFRLKMFTLLETKRFSVLFAVFSTFPLFETVFSTFCVFRSFWPLFGFVLFGRFGYVSDF